MNLIVRLKNLSQVFSTKPTQFQKYRRMFHCIVIYRLYYWTIITDVLMCTEQLILITSYTVKEFSLCSKAQILERQFWLQLAPENFCLCRKSVFLIQTNLSKELTESRKYKVLFFTRIMKNLI